MALSLLRGFCEISKWLGVGITQLWGDPQQPLAGPLCDFEQVISLYEPCLFLCKSRLSLAVLVCDRMGKWL